MLSDDVSRYIELRRSLGFKVGNKQRGAGVVLGVVIRTREKVIRPKDVSHLLLNHSAHGESPVLDGLWKGFERRYGKLCLVAADDDQAGNLKK